MPYFPQNQPEYNYLRHLQLLTYEDAKPVSKDDLARHFAHYNAKGKPDAWFFDSFLLIMTKPRSGNSLMADINIGTSRCGAGDFYAVPAPNPSNAADWEASINSYFVPDGMLKQMDEIVAALTPQLGAPAHKHNVVISIPYPQPNQWMFGRTTERGPRLNFSILNQNLIKATEQRYEACLWYVDQVIARWKKSRYRHLNLLGFYWVYESLHYSWEVDDHWVLKELKKRINARGQKLFWIPFYSSFNVQILTDYSLWFDCAMLQPNHMFYPWIKDVKQAAIEARDRNAGVEIEYYLNMPAKFGVGAEKHKRLRNYLDGGVKYGYMNEAVCGYFLGMNDLHKLWNHKNPMERQMYNDVFHFVKGDYSPKGR